MRTLLPVSWPIASLTPEKARRQYLAYAERPNHYTGKPISVATQQWVLLIGKWWGRWLVKSGASTINPFASVEPIGKPKAGKTQLTRDEAQRFSQVAIDRAQSGDVNAVGALLMLHLGLRQGEVSARVARNVGVANARLSKASQILALKESQAADRVAGFLAQLTKEELIELRQQLLE